MRTLRLLPALLLMAFNTSPAQWLSIDTARVCVPIRAGWNLLSNPVLRAPESDSTCVVYPGAYPCCPMWPGPGFYDPGCLLSNGRAAFLRFPSTQSICINGEPLTSLTLNLSMGWNRIGSISYPVPVSTVTTSPPGIIVSRFFAYEGMYVGQDTLQPGHGYWVKANQAGVMTLAMPPANFRGGPDK